ncbi:MAG TPA: 50S ribosomal protein L9 [Alphaproteobacteria bacterium]
MEVILLERVENLGQMGDVVRVRDGFARNYLLPRQKALRATKGNRERFERQRTRLEADNLTHRQEAEQVAKRMAGVSVVMVRQAGDTGQLYGSVNARDIAAAVTEAGYTVDRRQVALNQVIKSLGLHPARLVLHPEVSVEVKVNVARSQEEAKLQAAGVDVTALDREEAEREAAAAAAEAEAAKLFEEQEDAARAVVSARDEDEPAAGASEDQADKD